MKHFALVIVLCLFAAPVWAADPVGPNILVILADDLGYGDVQCLNPQKGKIATPHMDRVAKEGMIFTDAHTTSSVCTPTRYGILTGRYNWRTPLQKSVLWGFSEPLISADRLTVAGLLKRQGYTTAMIGKWHLGMVMPTTDGVLPMGRKPKKLNIVWDGKIKEGPVDRGFDTFFGISASLDMAPYIWINNDRFVGEIDNDLPPFEEPNFKKVDVLPELGRKAAEYIRSQKDSTKPFFAYVPLTSPHTPILPSDQWKGKSGLGSYGDFVMQTDDVIGQIVSAIDEAGLADNTLVIVTSDNGCSKAAKISKLEAQGHYPSAQFRGSKADLWDGGHRVPFLVRWPGVVESGSTCDQTICQTDLMATCAEITKSSLPTDAGEDSVSFLPALYRKPITTNRKGIIHHSVSGHFAYREGKWKLLLARGSGGWTLPNEKAAKKADLSEAQLYDLAADPGETTNLYQSKPEIAKQLLDDLTQQVQSGSSVAGKTSSNDTDQIILWKNNVKRK